MSTKLPESIQNLIEEFSRLPSVGPKLAARLTFYLLTKPENDIERLGNAILNLKKSLVTCKTCYNISETDVCLICASEGRKKNLLLAVEEPLDVIAFEKTGSFDGLYHVIGGVISPIDGIGPEDLRIGQLINRIQNEGITELILATNPSLEGEATASYIKNLLKDKDLKITRIARGLPVGGDLEYADEVTLLRSLEGRADY
jgi:recombination protein RecR